MNTNLFLHVTPQQTEFFISSNIILLLSFQVKILHSLINIINISFNVANMTSHSRKCGLMRTVSHIFFEILGILYIETIQTFEQIRYLRSRPDSLLFIYATLPALQSTSGLMPPETYTIPCLIHVKNCFLT